MCERLAHTARALRCASGSKLYATILYCVVSYPLSDMAFSHCLAANTLLPPLSGGFCHAASATSPPFFFVSLRFSLARRQCPSLGTKYWREPNKRTNQPFPSQSSPRIPPIIMDQRQIVMGVFFVPSSTSFSVCSATQLNELSVNHWKMSCSRHLYLKQQWVTVPAMFWLFLCWVSLRWRSWIYYTIRLLYSPTEQPFSNHRQLGYSPW